MTKVAYVSKDLGYVDLRLMNYDLRIKIKRLTPMKEKSIDRMFALLYYHEA